MNIILFNEAEINHLLTFKDDRAIHIKTILKLEIGDSFSAGIIGGSIGRCTIKEISDEGYTLEYLSENNPEPLYPFILTVGLTRPPVAKRMLKDMTTLGIEKIYFSVTQLGEKSYKESNLWKSEEYKDAMIEGAAQGVTTLLPEIKICNSIRHACSCIKESEEKDYRVIKLALDNVEKSEPLYIVMQKLLNANPTLPEALRAGKAKIVTAIGSERGFTDEERRILKQNSFILCSLGKRVLRTETAVPASLGIIMGACGYLD